MSSKFSLLTNAMPTFTKKTTVEAKVDMLTDYQVQLLEYLRYALSNLDADNFNASGLNEILEPVVAEIKNTEGDILSLWMTAEELSAKIEDADGNYTSLKATVNGLSTRVGTVEGNYSSLTQTVNGIQSTVSSHTTSINNQASTNTSLQSQITQTANKISAVVSAVDDSSGNVTAASIVAAINAAGSSVQISADHIQLAGDYVTISDLAGNGTVEINAGNIAAGGTISGAAFYTEGAAASGDPLSTSSVLIDDGVINMDGALIYRLFGDFCIEVPGGSNAVYISLGGYVWKFDRYGISLDGNYLVGG